MLELALEMRNRVDCIGVVVDVKPGAVAYYSTQGFKAIELVSDALGGRPEPVAMLLPIQQFEAALEETGKSAG
jgi:hypothetical protein